ncbi:C-type lectin domain family 4 member G-like [Fundulus heteroclitus]|uniref:C-type lectin domain family 4 member G-like n=1 Tax=Fundulus heteroclitus TaxID=8078 RepID=UPI00165C3695|nr:C-type lectin domain family 4 member G-like [Fundulus heteroclitus]
MAEEEVKYASVDIKTKKQPQAEAKDKKETVYDEVKVNKEPDQAETVEDAEYAEVQKQTKRFQQTPDTTGPLSDKAAEKCRRYQQLACCFGILCVLLVLSIIGVCVYFHESTANEWKSYRKLLREKTHNLTELTSDYENLTIQFKNLTAASAALEKNITTLTKENQQLQTERKNLTEQIETMEKPWNEQNISRAQWSVDEYCPKENKRNCSPCQKGWLLSQSSCYVVNNAEPPNQKTWEEAREDCRGKISDLTVVGDEAEKNFVKDNSWVNDNIKGYWIGLRAEGGKWRWIDGSDLTNQAWIQQQSAVDGQCVTSLQDREWRSMSCDEKNAWICEKKALSVET